MDIRIKLSGLKVIYSKVPSSGDVISSDPPYVKSDVSGLKRNFLSHQSSIALSFQNVVCLYCAFKIIRDIYVKSSD